MDSVNKPRRGRQGWQWLFLIEFVLALWPPFYNKLEPTLFGIPFFYWYQLVLVLVAAVITAVVYLKTRP
jgi:dolichyl-phosphate-mannose--protein O-mannosyl transferase